MIYWRAKKIVKWCGCYYAPNILIRSITIRNFPLLSKIKDERFGCSQESTWNAHCREGCEKRPKSFTHICAYNKQTAKILRKGSSVFAMNVLRFNKFIAATIESVYVETVMDGRENFSGLSQLDEFWHLIPNSHKIHKFRQNIAIFEGMVWYS